MALVRQTIQASTAAVWDALIDPTTYPRWLIGAQEIRDVDDSWPAVDAAFHHRVGVWPVLIDDKSIIREVRPRQHLVLEVRATPAVRGLVRFDLEPADAGRATVVEMSEEPLYRLVGNVLRPILDPLTHLRNMRSLVKFEELVEAHGR